MAEAVSPRRSGLRVIVLTLLLAAGAWGIWQSTSTPEPSVAERTAQIIEGLGCPTCEGQSLAQSRSEIALQMRAVVESQISAGRSDDEVRAWFAARYGDGILLEPPMRGPGLVLWLVPVLVGGGGLALVLRARDERWSGRARATAVAVGAAVPLVVWALVSPSPMPDPPVADGPEPTAEESLAQVLTQAREHEAAGEPAVALEAYQRAHEMAPQDATIATRLAYLLLRSDRPDEAASVAGSVAQDAESTDALLVLGLAQWALGDSTSHETLGAFLELEPHHPAVDQVREMLTGPPPADTP